MSRQLIAVFDFDMTLLDTSSLQADRDARRWASVRRAAPGLSFDASIIQSLRELTAAGTKLAIASSAPRWYLDSFLRRLDVDVEAVLGNGDATRSSEPGLSTRARIKAGQLLRLAQQFPTATLVFIGDDADDEAGAYACGVNFIHACWGGGCAAIGGTHARTPASLLRLIAANRDR